MRKRLAMGVGLIALLAPGAAEAARLHDLEMGVRLEAPVTSTTAITESGRGNSTHARELYVGGHGEVAWAMTSSWSLLGVAGTRIELSNWSVEDPETPTVYMQHRVLRVAVGAKRSFTNAPTFPYASAGVGMASAAWLVSYGGSTGDRVSPGVGGWVAGGVDHFLNPRFAVGAELRGWMDAYPGEQQAVDGWAFDLAPTRAGLSLVAGVTFR